jgi:hypothetical protein
MHDCTGIPCLYQSGHDHFLTAGIEIKKICYIYNIQNKTRYVRFSSVLCIVLVIAMSGYSCKEKGGKYIDQGEIHYDISYKGNFIVPVEALPQNLVVSFKKSKILFEMVGLGNSGIVNLANPDKGIYDTYYSFFNVQKYYYEAKAGELFPGFASMSDMHIKKTDKTAIICGYNCKSAEVMVGDDPKVHEIWYTQEIKIKNPNASTPYSEIDGVLLSFFFIMGSSEISFMAETVYNKEIPDELFERRQKYGRVTKEDIEEVMDGIFDQMKNR